MDVKDQPGEPLPPIPRPESGDVLFREAPHCRDNASVSFFGDGWELYASSYKDAGDSLGEKALEGSRPLDLVIFPIVFLYRHYLELRLKEMILSGSELATGRGEIKKEHRLDVLWQEVRKLLTDLWQNDTSTEIAAVENCIAEICRVDRESMGFRYPVDLNGKRLIAGLEHVDVRNLRDVIRKIANFLDGSSSALSAHLDEVRSLHRETP